MFDGYDTARGSRPGFPTKKYSVGTFVGLGICQIICGAISATAGIIYIVKKWQCFYVTYFNFFCPQVNGPMYGSGSGIWSGLSLIIAGSVACGVGGQKTRGCIKGTIATSVFSMITSGACVALTTVELRYFDRLKYGGADRGFLLAIYITVIASSVIAFLFSIILIIFGATDANISTDAQQLTTTCDYSDDPTQGPILAVPTKKYPAKLSFRFGICQICFGVINAAAGIVYTLHPLSCDSRSFCPRFDWPMNVGSGIWSGGLLIIAGSVACRAGRQKTKGYANGTIATSIFSMVSSIICIGFTAWDFRNLDCFRYSGGEGCYLLAMHITLLACSTTAFIFSIFLIIFGIKGVHVAVSNPNYVTGTFIELGICQIILGVINATAGITYLVLKWGHLMFGYKQYFQGVWSGILLILAGSVAWGAGVKKTKGCANGTIAASVVSMVTSFGCFGLTSVDLYQIPFQEAYSFHVAIWIILIACTAVAFMFSIVLIVFGVKAANATQNTVSQDIDVPLLGQGGGIVPNSVMVAMHPTRKQPSMQTDVEPVSNEVNTRPAPSDHRDAFIDK